MTTALSPARRRRRPRTSLAGALDAAETLPGRGRRRARTTARQHAFVDGIHLAVTVGAILALVAAVIVVRATCPATSRHEGAMHGPVEAIEDAAELGLAGVPPIFADGPDDTAAEVLDPGARGDDRPGPPGDEAGRQRSTLRRRAGECPLCQEAPPRSPLARAGTAAFSRAPRSSRAGT